MLEEKLKGKTSGIELRDVVSEVQVASIGIPTRHNSYLQSRLFHPECFVKKCGILR